MKAYLDNMIASGMVTRDLCPPQEMLAVDQIKAKAVAGKLELVTSREAWREQGRTQDQSKRQRLESKQSDLPVVPDDHRVLEVQHQADHLGGFNSLVAASDIVDEKLFNDLMNVPAKFDKQHRRYQTDMRHLANAVQNGCGWFVTLDEEHILDRRSEFEPLCRGLRIVRPSELLREICKP
jgi:predicted nucleic acid-binding protein